jgi:FkbM family methyltransferase
MISVRVSSPIYGIASRAYRNVFDSWLTPRLPGGAPQIAFATIGIARGSRRDLQMYGHRGSGGWTIPAEAIAPGAICYCAGVGEDVSFDLALIEKHACEVFSFDPTPRSIEFVGNEVDADPRFHFLPYGIWSEDRTMTFHQPEEGLMFHSLTTDTVASSQFDAECKRLVTLMRELGHDHIDLLKLDIEGAEYDVVDDLVTSGIRPRVLCVEFHGVAHMDASMWRLRRSLRALAQAGYRIVHIEHLNFTFLRAGETSIV